MSIYDDEFYEVLSFVYELGAENGKTQFEITMQQPTFPKAVHEFLNLAMAIYQWSPGEIRAKTRDALDEWLV